MHLRHMAVMSVCMLTAACGGLTPVDPSRVTVPIEGDLDTTRSVLRNTVQRVEEDGGSGGGDLPCDEKLICIQLGLRAGAENLEGETRLPLNASSSLLNFSLSTVLWQPREGINDTPPGGFVIGRFYYANLQMSVNNGSANVTIGLKGPFDLQQTFTATGTAPVVQSQTPCTPVPFHTYKTFAVITIVDMELQHLGRTRISVREVVRCAE